MNDLLSNKTLDDISVGEEKSETEMHAYLIQPESDVQFVEIEADLTRV